MSTDSLIWFVFILILIEYNFRLRRSIGKRAEEKFEKMKEEFIKKQKEKKPSQVKRDVA